MKKGSKKSSIQPIVPKTKEQILAEMKNNVDFQKRMKFVREQFWPALVDASQSISDASILLSGFNTTLMQEFLGWMKKVQVSELKLEEKLDKESPKYKENLAMLALFSDMNVFEAKDLIEGMKGEVQLFIEDELKDRPLSTLKAKWIND